MSKKRKINLPEKVYHNIDLARNKVEVEVIVDKNYRRIGKVVHRWVDNPEGARCHTSVIMSGYMNQNPSDPIYGYYVSGGYGYDKKAHNISYYFVENREQIETLTGLPYPKDPEPDLYTYFANYWKNYLKDAGYTVILAL